MCLPGADISSRTVTVRKRPTARYPPIGAVAALWMPAVCGLQNGDPCTLLAPILGDGAGLRSGVGPCVAEAGGFGQAVSRMALRLRRSLRVARFMAMVMRGAVSLGKPAGSPRLRSVIRVEPSSMACQV